MLSSAPVAKRWTPPARAGDGLRLFTVLPPGTSSMPIEVAACQTPEELLPAFTPVFHYFGLTPAAQDGERFVPFIEPTRAFAARENGVVVGGCGSFPLEHT